MKRIIISFIVTLSVSVLFPYTTIHAQDAYTDNKYAITDFIQIYHGYEKRPAWHTDQIKHYVYRDNNGQPEWLFDGFLFLEIYAHFDGRNYDYGAEQPGKYMPDKAGWENLICKNFQDTRGPNAIEAVLDSLAQKGFYPPKRRKVVFSIPNPIYGQKDWGFVGDKALDFTNSDDRYLAVEWYVKRIIEEWNKKGYKHIDFGGFYWTHEQVDFHNQDDVVLMKMNKMLKEKGTGCYWLPHYGAQGVDKWNELGFLYAYQQPNYFFYSKENPHAIINTVKNTQKHKLGIMMEFDGRALDEESFRKSFYDYINTFRENGVWANQPVNYYDGGNGWLRLATENAEETKKMHKILGDIIVKRNNKLK
jgi:hypothetical protein